MKRLPGFKFIKLILCFTVYSLSATCDLSGQIFKEWQVPFTDRYQLIWLKEPELIAKANETYTDFLKLNPPLPDADYSVMLVRKVGDRIVKATQELLNKYDRSDRMDGCDFEFNVIPKNEVNGWSLPGGKIAIYTAILPFCRDEGRMAVLLSHEIAHVIAQHGNERLSQAFTIQIGLETLKDLLNGKLDNYYDKYNKIFDIVFDVTSDVGLLAYSREHEYEADLIGMYIMAYAGYNPAEAQQFWQKMMEAQGNQKYDFLSTHPATAKRLEEIKSNIPAAEKFYRNQ